MASVLEAYAEDRSQEAHSATLRYSIEALKRHIGDLPVMQIGRQTGRTYTDARRREGPGGAAAPHRRKPKALSDGTIIRELGVLRAALAWAKGERWIPYEPTIARPPAPPPRDRWLTHAEGRRLLAACDAPHVKLFVALALFTAARSGAILDLVWERVDLDDRVINFGAGHGLKRRAQVPVGDELLPLLRDAAEAATCQAVVEFRGAPVGSIKTGFKAACRRAGIKNVTPHVLRHTAVTWMVMAGLPAPKVARFAGMSEALVEKTYGHHSPDFLRDASAALSLRSGFSGPTGTGNKTPELETL